MDEDNIIKIHLDKVRRNSEIVEFDYMVEINEPHTDDNKSTDKGFFKKLFK